MVSGNDSEDVIVDTCACGGEKRMKTEEPETSATRSDEKSFQEKKDDLVQDSLMMEQNSLDFVVTGGMEEVLS